MTIQHIKLSGIVQHDSPELSQAVYDIVVANLGEDVKVSLLDLSTVEFISVTASLILVGSLSIRSRDRRTTYQTVVKGMSLSVQDSLQQAARELGIVLVSVDGDGSIVIWPRGKLGAERATYLELCELGVATTAQLSENMGRTQAAVALSTTVLRRQGLIESEPIRVSGKPGRPSLLHRPCRVPNGLASA